MSGVNNKTTIGSIIFLDIINYSKLPISYQLTLKTIFNEIITNALKRTKRRDRIILDTGDGAAIAYLGPPEDALFISHEILSEILNYNKLHETALHVRIGINLGPVCLVHDINRQLNIIGDGINVAQRVMSFALPNKILVSQSYFEVTSRLTDELACVFEPIGIKQDKHKREHHLYLVKHESMFTKKHTGYFESKLILIKSINDFASDRGLLWLKAVAATFALSLFAGMIYLGSGSHGSAIITAPRPVKILPAPVVEAHAIVEPEIIKPDTVKVEMPIMPIVEEPVSVIPVHVPDKIKDTTIIVKKEKKTYETSNNSKSSEKDLHKTHIVKEPAKKEMSWKAFKESFKHGSAKPLCSQAEAIMNQCDRK